MRASRGAFKSHRQGSIAITTGWHERRSAAPDGATLEWVRRSVDARARVAGVGFLPGGSYSAIHRVRLGLPNGSIREVVIRRWLDPDWQRNDPDLSPDHEAAALRLAEQNHLPAPRLLALDLRGDQVGVPALVMTSLPGEPTAHRPLPQRWAPVLAAIHTVREIADVLPGFGFYNDASVVVVPRLSKDAGLWSEAVDRAGQPPASPPASLIHRDFNPGNVLWRGDRISGVVDWGAACWGPAQVDVAHLRWNLAVRHGVSTADAFLQAYGEAASGYRHDAYWDVRGVLDLLPETEIHVLDAETLAALETYLREVLS